jgi:putative Mg2+ transporter-C (MgtC) family protein
MRRGENGVVISHLLAVGRPNIEGWRQVGELGLALLLSALIGVERQIRQKSAGLRTHALVGVGAAQIVTGIGFIGGGLIFVRRDAVRGLATAAAVWVTAAIGAAAGAGLPVLAGGATAIYFLVVLGFPPLARLLPTSTSAISVIRVRYHDGRGVLRDVLGHTTAQGFLVAEIATEPVDPSWGAAPGRGDSDGRGVMVEVLLQIHGRGSVNHLAAELSELPGVNAVTADDVHSASE